MDTALVVFDMAGTTVRDKGNVAQSFMAAFRELDIDVPLERVNQVMGYRKKEAIRMLLEGLGREKNNGAVINAIHDHFEEKMLGFYMSDRELMPLPYVEETFQWLHSKGIKVALNTGFTRYITEGILYRLEWKGSPMIDEIICSDEVPEGRPSPYMIHELMRRMKLEDPATVVKVGDTEVDIAEGRNAKCGKVISVTTGAYTKEQLEVFHPDQIIDSLSKLPQLIS